MNPNKSERKQVFLVLIVFAAVLPSAIVLYFMNLALKNEQLASQQLQSAALSSYARQIQESLTTTINAIQLEIQAEVDSVSPALAFAGAIQNQFADGLIIYSEGDELLYPDNPVPILTDTNTAQEALNGFQSLRLDIQQQQWDTAGSKIAAIMLDPERDQWTDASGRHLLSNIELYLLEQSHDLLKLNDHALNESLVKRLNNYAFPLLHAAQRRFIMGRYLQLDTQSNPVDLFPTLNAEQLSARYLEARPERKIKGVLTQVGNLPVWQLPATNGRFVALYTEEGLRQRLNDWVAATEVPVEYEITITNTSLQTPDADEGLVLSLFDSAPEWRLTLFMPNLGNTGLLSSSSITYVVISSLSILFIGLLLFIIARATTRRMEMAQLKNTMVATVSHELKTPVSSIKFLVDSLLESKRLDPVRVKEYLALIERENSRLSQLIENFLSFSRIERQQFTLTKEPFVIAKLVNEAAEIFQQQVDKEHLVFTVNCSLQKEIYEGDYSALLRVLLNLLDNAFKYSSPPRKISLNVWYENGFQIQVVDQGIGIKASEQTTIFDQFYQIDQKLSRSREGCGLGLSIVKHIVQAHGGKISVESELGKGSTFTVFLPNQLGSHN